ncbi:MFS-type transporter M2-like protein [Cladobotryum mycophilum]|uniref:MFS-type transporter M2-like protein n=1 Tax=Cladobotryum mycophilum TaxID=491253 RepID=A0ABR0S6V9_9HYPO
MATKTREKDGLGVSEETALLSGSGSGSGSGYHDGSTCAARATGGASSTTQDNPDTTAITITSTSPTSNSNPVSNPDQDQNQDQQKDTPKYPLSPSQGALLALSLWLLIFIQATNMSGMTMIQGTLADDLDAHEKTMWFTTCYLIALSSLTPIVGRLASIFSPGAIVLPTAGLFSLGCLVASRASSFRAFILGRVVMGSAAAGVVTLAVIFVIELTAKKNRGFFIGLVNAAFTMGVSCGAAVYGALLPVVGWRPLLWGQAPFVLLSGLGIYLSLPDMSSPNDTSAGDKPSTKIDYLGAILLTSTIVLFLTGLAGDIQPLLLALSLLTLLLFILTEYRLAPSPIIPLKVLSSRGVLLTCLAQLGLMSARWTVLFYAPIFMLAVQAAPPARAGSVLVPTNLGLSVGGLVVGWLHIRRGGSYWLPALLSTTAFNVILYAIGSLTGYPNPSSSVPFVLMVCANGIVMGVTMNYTLVHLLHLSHPDTEYITTGLLATFRGFGGSFGTSIGGGIFYRLLRANLVAGYLALDGGDGSNLTEARHLLISKLLGSPELVHHGGLSPEDRQVAVEGYAGAMRGVWQAAAALVLVVMVLQAATGWTAPKQEISNNTTTRTRTTTQDESQTPLLENDDAV